MSEVNEQTQELVKLIALQLIQASENNFTGKLNFDIEFNQGGVRKQKLSTERSLK